MIILSNTQDYAKNSKHNSISVQSINHISSKSSGNYSKSRLYASELIFVTDGTLDLEIDSAAFPVSENEYTIIPPYAAASGTTADGCRYYSVIFSGRYEISAEWKKAESFKRVHSIFGSPVFLYELFKRMLSAYSPSVRSNNHLDILFIAALYELDSLSREHTKSGVPLKKIQDYIKNHTDKPITLSELCNEFNYSSDYISKEFKKHYGITAKKYINQIKLSAAKQYLLTSNLSAEKVGKRIGFSDVKLFYKFFKYHEKITPNEYRKRELF